SIRVRSIAIITIPVSTGILSSMSSHALIPVVSIQNYLAAEQRSEQRHEYISGELFAMVGASRAHNTIAGNLFALLHTHLGSVPCRAFMSDMKVRIDKTEAFYYPDIVVSCEPRDDRALFLSSPLLIVEVLSPATENIDRREKRLAYQHLESLQEYVLVAQELRRIEVYRRNDSTAFELEIYGDEETARLRSLDLDLPLDRIYEGTG
ncbi:MAG: Uma2 family endonuclease, partial [Gammaproteobacteria bacterium]